MTIHLKMKVKSLFLIFFLVGAHVFSYAQSYKDNPPPNWYNLDYNEDGVMGISTEKAYKYLEGRKSEKVIVAVLDGGTDIEHEDLKEVVWVNEKENADNGKDNDGNGYAGDVYGWNFIGGADGENVQYDNLEVTRLIKKYEPKYMSVLPSTPLSAKEKKEFIAYQKMVRDYTDKLDEANFGHLNYSRLKGELDTILHVLEKDTSNLTQEDLKRYQTKNDRTKMALKIARQGIDEEGSFGKFYEQITDAEKYYNTQLEYHLNKDYESRGIVGDDYEDVSEKYYGNNDVIGPDAEHGTHVAGIVGAKRDNGIGIDGVADNVEIMAVRVVPDGDERDKDVANAIRYAVDNGAKVINMSFGKGYAYNKETLDEAIRYAEEKDVLLVHAAGNDNKDTDIHSNYPTKYYTDSLDAVTGEATNYITVGATKWLKDKELVAPFSNYGYKSVDVFAPGVKINSTMPGSTYKEMQGTSMAAPVVTGLAAILRSYFPSMTAPEVKNIILESVTKVDQKINLKTPEGNRKVFLDEISVAGGVANAYEAVVLADIKGNK